MKKILLICLIILSIFLISCKEEDKKKEILSKLSELRELYKSNAKILIHQICDSIIMNEESIIVNVNLTSMFLKNNYDTIEKAQDIIFSIDESRDAIALGYQKEAIDYSIDKLSKSLDKKLANATMI